MEVVEFGKKVEKYDVYVKFKNHSVIQDEILDYQISPFDKSSLGYNSGKKFSSIHMDT